MRQEHGHPCIAPYSYRVIYAIEGDDVLVLAVIHKGLDMQPEMVERPGSQEGTPSGDGDSTSESSANLGQSTPGKHPAGRQLTVGTESQVSGTRARVATLEARAVVADARRLAGRRRVRHPGPSARARCARVAGVDGGGIMNGMIKDGSARQCRAWSSSA